MPFRPGSAGNSIRWEVKQLIQMLGTALRSSRAHAAKPTRKGGERGEEDARAEVECGVCLFPITVGRRVERWKEIKKSRNAVPVSSMKFEVVDVDFR